MTADYALTPLSTFQWTWQRSVRRSWHQTISRWRSIQLWQSSYPTRPVLLWTTWVHLSFFRWVNHWLEIYFLHFKYSKLWRRVLFLVWSALRTISLSAYPYSLSTYSLMQSFSSPSSQHTPPLWYYILQLEVFTGKGLLKPFSGSVQRNFSFMLVMYTRKVSSCRWFHYS